MYRKHIAYTGFQSICGFRHLLGILERVPTNKRGGLLYMCISTCLCCRDNFVFVCEIVTGKLNLQSQPRGDDFVTYSGPCHTSPTSTGQARGCLTQYICNIALLLTQICATRPQPPLDKPEAV